MFNSSEAFLTFIQIPNGDVIRADTITRMRIIKGNAEAESGYTVVIERDQHLCGPLNDIDIPCKTEKEAIALRDHIFSNLGTNKS
jgi:hypothetical protein